MLVVSEVLIATKITKRYAEAVIEMAGGAAVELVADDDEVFIVRTYVQPNTPNRTRDALYGLQRHLNHQHLELVIDFSVATLPQVAGPAFTVLSSKT